MAGATGNAVRSAPGQTPRPGRSAPAYKLKVSSYDRSSSLLISLLILIGMVVAGLLIIYITSRFSSHTVTVPIAVADAASRPADAAQGLKRDPEPPGLEDAPELTEPALPQTLSALANAASSRSAVLADMAIESEFEAGRGKGLGDSRAAGTGGEGLGGVLHPAERWKITYLDPGNLTVYAQQLDYFKIELGVNGTDNLYHKASGFSTPSPVLSTITPEESNKKRILPLSFSDGKLRRSDRRILQKAGVKVGNRVVAQFYPLELQSQIQAIELDYAKRIGGGKTLPQIRRTKFVVEKTPDGFQFKVTDQRYR